MESLAEFADKNSEQMRCEYSSTSVFVSGKMINRAPFSNIEYLPGTNDNMFKCIMHYAFGLSKGIWGGRITKGIHDCNSSSKA